MKFVNPYILLLIPGAAVMAVWGYMALDKRKRQLLTAVLGKRADDPQAVHLSRFRRNLKRLLLLSAVVLLVIAAARPYYRTVSRDVSVSGSDVLILFDVSKSMRATDLPPSRMEQAKYLLREVLGAFPQDRFGIVPFAGSAFLSCPLTADHTALNEALEDLNTDSVPLGGTNIEKALQTAQRAFAGAAGSHRAVILLTDGDELSGNAAAMTAELKKNNIPLAVVGFGDPAVAAPVPDGQGGVMRSGTGQIAGSKLNEATLRRLAADTGGIYIRSQVSDTGFGELKKFLDKLDRSGYSTDAHREVADIFPWFLAAALVFLMASAALPERKKVYPALLCLAVLALPAAGAEELKLPDDPYELYARGRKLQQKDDKAATGYYEKAVQSPDTPDLIRSAALQNLGVMQHRDGREELAQCRQALQTGKLDEALKYVGNAMKKFTAAQEIYTRSMQFSTENKTHSAAGNFRQALRDRHIAAELKKQIEKLQQQQQQARQQTKQAQQQNQQNKQDKQDKQQQKQQDQQNQQQTQQAQRAAEELSRQAAKLEQQELADSARNAAKKLDEAQKLQQQGKKSEAQKKLDEAAGLLGEPAPEQKPQPQSAPQPEKSDRTDKNSNSPPQTVPDKKAEKSDKERANERKLELLDDEAKTLRQQMQKLQRSRRNQVEKDW